MRKRRILVLVVILIIFNVAFAQEENDSNELNESNEISSENNEQEEASDNKDAKENGPNIADNKNVKTGVKRAIQNDMKAQLYTLTHHPDTETDFVPYLHKTLDSYKNQQCKCNEGLDCKCDNSTLGNIQCHCADFDNLAKLNKGYTCKCEKDVLRTIQLKCQCARKDSKQNVIKTVTCTSVSTFTQSHIRDISFGNGGKLQLYEKDEQEKKILMTDIKDINDVLDILNRTHVINNFSDVIIDLRHLTEIDAVTLLKQFLYHHEFLLQHFNMCGCKNVSGVALCHCNDKLDLFTIEHPTKCLCMPMHNKRPNVECMCNEHSHKPKLLYYPQVFEIFKCICSISDNGENLICECNESGNFAYNYDKILVDIRDVEKDHIMNLKMQLEIPEFESFGFNSCNCTYAEPSWDCECSVATTEFKSQNNLAKCLCLDQNKDGKKTQCLCSNHILEPTVLFNSKKIDMYGCVCYNQYSETKILSLKCDCKQREDKQDKYDDVVIDISKIENANLSHIITELNYTAQFYQKYIDSCNCSYHEGALICNCLAPTDTYTEENPSQCLCKQHTLSGNPNCICNPNLHSVNIIYSIDIDIQQCLCSQFLLSSHAVSCRCIQKVSYTQNYKNAMIDIVHWSQYTLATILVQLLHITQYSREHFNLCACTINNGKYSCACQDAAKPHIISNSFCISDNVYPKSKYKYCICNRHFRSTESVGIRYQQMDDKYIEECTCSKGDNEKSLICGKCTIKNSVHHFSENRYEGEVHIPDTTENQLNTILSIILRNFAQQDRKINKCQCTENLDDCTCDHSLRPYESPKGELRCVCVADYYYVDRPLRCGCNPRILDREVKFNERMYDIRFCYAYATQGDKNKVFCKPQRPSLPRYDFVIGVTSTDIVHIRTLREYIIEARSDFDKENFNMCNCKKVGNAFKCNCAENTEVYTESSMASCQCILYGEDSGVECICSPHILQFEIAFYAQQIDIDGCRCYHKENAGEKQLTCEECIRRTPLEMHPRWTLDPIYHNVAVIIPDDVENQLDVIISYVLKIFKPNDKVINHCQCTNNFKDCTCKYPVGPYKLEGVGQLDCLCLDDFYYNDRPMQCGCNPHILEPNITYLTSKYDIRRTHCFVAAVSSGNGHNVICQPADIQGNLEHAVDRVVVNIKKSLIIQTKNIFEYIIQQQEFQHEKFTFCICTNDNEFNCSCDIDTSRYTINHERNCLCIVPSNITKNVECICNAIVLQFGIIFEENYDLEACRCYHSVDALNKNQLICRSCIKRVSYEQNPHFIYHRNYTENVVIKPNTDNQLSTIIAHIVKQFNVNDRVVNYCKCKEDLTDFICEYPVTPYLLLKKNHLNCFCVADYYYTDHPVRCGCNPYILQPKVFYNSTLYDFRFVSCAPYRERLICEQLNQEIIPGQINKIVVEVTESRIIEISHFVDYILQQKGYTGEHVNICGCKETSDGYLSCNCKGTTQGLTITNTGSCLYFESLNAENKYDCICNPHILQLGLIFNSKMHLGGCRCYKSIYEPTSTSLICTQCKKRETFELNPRFDYGVSYHNTIVKITDVLENQLTVVINYIFNYAKFSIQNRVINECSCKDDLSYCTCNRPLLPYAERYHKLRCFCIADYFYDKNPIKCACNPFLWQIKILYNPSVFDLRYIECSITEATDRNNVNTCVYLEGKPAPKPQDKVVVRIKKEVRVNIVVIMEFILRRAEYTGEKFKLLKCSISNEGHYSCSCDSDTDTCKKESRCSCLCVIPSAYSQNEVIECMCNPHVLQFGIQFSGANHLEGCRCYQVTNKDGSKSIICDKCIRRISYEHQTRFDIQRDYTKTVVTIHPRAENQIEVIQRLIVKHFDISDQIVVYCSCTENLMDCQCESSINQFITREGILKCFCLADYYYAEYPIRCACNPLIVQPILIYNETKYDFKYINCLSADLEGLIVSCNDTHKIILTPHPADRAVVLFKTPIKQHFADIIEYITTYRIYRDEEFNLCFDCTTTNSQISCKCNNKTTSYNVEHLGSCLCITNPGKTPECMCGPHILQIGIIFHDVKVQACRCYHSIEDKSSVTSLVCQDCSDRKSFEYNPRFDTTKNIYGVLAIHIDDHIQNQIEYIYEIIVRQFIQRNDQIVNFCQCLPDLETCNCKYSVEPYLVDGKLRCFCISDYYYTKYPYQCACNPFILQPTVTCDERKFEFRYLDCTLVAHSKKDIICKERHSSPKPPSAEYKLVMRLRNIEISIRIIKQYLLQTELYKYEPLISCNCIATQNKYSCNCLNNTEVYDIHNKSYGLCITSKRGSDKSTECLINPRILQFGIVYYSNSTALKGCQCYHSKFDKNNKNSLVCEQCHEIISFEFNPHFDKEHNYSSVIIAIPRFTEHEINSIVGVIFSKFNSSDQFINHCECTENMKRCICDYSISAYIQINHKMPCVCVTDYFYDAYPVRCACNPFMIQPEYDYNTDKYDIRLIECTESKDGLRVVNCNQVKPKPPTATVVLDTTVWQEVQVKIIEEYILSYPQYSDEQFKHCSCSWNDVASEFSCDCSDDTSKYTIQNMCSCLCVTPSGSKESLGCTCNPRIFQIGYKYKTSINDFYGCRCYHSIESNRAKSLICHRCKVIPSYEQAPHFKFNFKNTQLVINITNIIFQNRIEIIIPLIINHIPVIPHRLINYCYCREDNTDCTCQYPVESYVTQNEEVTCLCITDFYYPDYNLRCGCNPFILQPSIIYDTRRYHFKRLHCIPNKEDKLRMENCQTFSTGGLPSIDQIVVDISVEREVTIQTIITYILYHRIYKDEVFNKCTCHRDTNGLPSNCTCIDPTVVCTARETCNCLCLAHSSEPKNIECMCNPLSLQFGVIFNSTMIIIEACHFYHPLHDKNTRSLIAHECVRRESYDKHPHFNTDYVYNITGSIKITTLTENQLSYVLDVVRIYFEKRDRIFNKCQCTENLSTCTCKNSISPYLQKNHKMPCLCIADYFYSDLPLQCGCNPFMLQVTFKTLVYSTSKFDFRWLECFEHDKSVKCTLVEREVEGPISADKVVFDMTRLVKVNIEIIIEHILSYTQYVKEHFNQCNCLMNNQNQLNCNCKDDTSIYIIEKKCSCLCYKFAQNPNSVCICNSHILQLGIVFHSNVVEITACRCYHENGANNLLLKCDDCRKRYSFEVNPRFDLRKEYRYEVEIGNNIENILINILTVKHERMEFNDRIVNYCDCPENGINCKCAYAIEPFINGVENTMPCFCMSDYYYLIHPLRCACNPFVTQQQLIYNSRIFDFRIGSCVADLGDKEHVTCSFESLGNDPQYPEYKFVIKIRDLHLIDIGIIKEFLIKSLEFKYEDFNDCKCDSQLLCACNKPTTEFTMTNKANCLFHKTGNTVECICNPRILQVGIVFNPDKENLQGCRCYHPRNSETERTLLCDECIQRQSFEWNPRFDLTINYFGKQVYIPPNIENQIDVIFSYIIKILELKHQIINHCECSGNLIDCKCDYPVQAYSQKTGSMPCVCISDYYYKIHPVRCRCNPYILQLDIHYDTIKYNLIKAYCVSHTEDKDIVTCKAEPSEKVVSTDQVILDITHLVVIHITTITEYIFSFPQFHGERFNSCQCSRHGTNGLKCNCKNDTSEFQIHNMRSCLCFTLYTKGQTLEPECICNAHILQIGIIFDSKIISWEGCRCYNPGSDSKTSLDCIQCNKIDSLVDAPRFDIINKNYSIGVDPVRVPAITENQLVIIRQYIIQIFENNDRFTNECDCTEDFTFCQCRNKIKYYFQLNGKMPCFCVADYFYNDLPMRCDCNPFILQLQYKYDVTKFDFKYVECFGKREENIASCEVEPKPHIPQPRPSADLVVLDMTHITEIRNIKHIYEYIWSYPQYHDHITKCKCLNNSAVLNCDCEDVTMKVTIQSKWSCLCFVTKDNELECLCNPHILQLGIIFDSDIHSILGCRCYHSIHDYQTRTLVCDDCIPRISFSHRPRFDLNLILKYDVILPNKTENIIANILDITLNQTSYNNRLVDYCSCSEDLKNCSCKYPISSYCVDNVLFCFCIADYFYIFNPIRCGCNPFVLEPKVIYSQKLYDIRHIHCTARPEDNTKVNCVKIPGSPEPHNPEFKQVLKLRNVIVTIAEIRARLDKNEVLKDELYNLCSCHYIDGIQTCECNDVTTEFTIHHQSNSLCVYDGNKIDCICNPRILQIGIVYDSEKALLKGCRCYHPKTDENTRSLICRDCVQRNTFEMNPRFDQTNNYTGKIVKIPSIVTFELDDIYIYLVSQFEDRDKIVNHCECLSDYKHCKCDYSIGPYSRNKDHKMPCTCIKDNLNGLYTVDCICNPFMMQPTLDFENLKLSYAECISINNNKNDVNCTEINIAGPPPPWSGEGVTLEGNFTIPDILHHVENVTGKHELFNICNCTKMSENNIEQGLSCTSCIYGADLYKQNKNTSCLCAYHQENDKNASIECMCHNYVLQLMIFYDKALNTLIGCECYYSEKHNGLICPKCNSRPSAPEVPTFTNFNYTGVIVDIPLRAGVDMTIIRPIISKYLNGSDKMINRCWCGDEFENCRCMFTADSYAHSDGNIYCVCADDYYNYAETMQCGCNPFLWQLKYEYSKSKLNLRYMKCVTELSGKLNCIPRDAAKTTSVVVYNAKKIHLIDMNVVIEYLLTFSQYYKEEMILCSCTSVGRDKMDCKACSSETVKYTTAEKIYCLCQQSKNNRDRKSKHCVCNSFILQSEYIFNSENNKLTGCRCYNKAADKNKEALTCTQCKARESYELHPRFDLSRDYSKVTVIISNTTENDINVFLNFLVKDFKVEDKVVNFCKCTEDSKNCLCKFPIKPYLRGNKMNCFCISDYYYIEDPIRCACNPFIFQPTKHTFNKVQDIRKSYCWEKMEGGVTCEVFSGYSEGNTVYRYVLNIRNLRVVNIGIIKEYLYKSEEYANEPLNSCDCTFKEDKKNGDKFECSLCSYPTNMYTIHNRANCLCVMPAHKTAHPRVECLCGPHILQLGVVYNTKVTDLRGCRCYGNDNDDGFLTCIDCINRVSFELNPHFDLQISYNHVQVVIDIYVENQIEILLNIITKNFERDHQIVNLCECTENYGNCRCDYPVKPYLVFNHLQCICTLDHYYIDYPVRCGCNPYIFQPKIVYDDQKYILRFVECTDPNKNKDNLTCALTSRNVNLNLPHPIFVNFGGTVEIHMLTILEYLFCYTEYQGQTFNLCNCTKINSDLSCVCQNSIEIHTKNIMHNCLCVLTSSLSSSCICHPRVQQFGIVFNSSSTILESCRCYHSTFDPNDNTLQCHECHKRKSISEHVRFDYSHNYSDVRVETTYNIEVHIETIIEIFVRVFNSTDQVVNYCKCKENSENCICDYPVTNYLLPNGELHCVCIDDFYDTMYPVRCGCNPFVTQPRSSYNISQFSKEPNYLNFRQFVCVQTVSSYNVKCSTLAYDHPLDASVVSLQHLQYINIEIIQTYFLMKRKTERYNLCNCELNVNGKLVCHDCKDVTTQCSIRNPCNCFCIKNKQLKCLCNPRVLQFSLRFKSNVEYLGCRCYHSIYDKQSNNSLQCNECLNRVSIERAPQFDIHVSYRHLTIIIPGTLERRIDSLIALIISKFKDVYQIVLNCLCTKEFSPDCTCDYPYSVYAFDGVLNCLCMEDNTNPKYGLRCACNPYILHPSLTLDNWQGVDVIRMNCSSANADSMNVHCEGSKVPPYDVVLRIPSVPEIHIQYILEILQRIDVFKNQQFILCNCQQTKENSLDCNCENNTLAYTIENQCNCLCVHNLKSALYRPVIECLCNAHIHQPRLTYDESAAMFDKCNCYNDGRYDSFLKCSCRKALSYKMMYRNNYGHVTVEVPHISANASSIKRLEHVRDTIIQKFAPEDQEYSNCRCMENMEKCTCARSIEEYSYKTVTPCVCSPDNLNKTYPMACTCNRHILQPKVKFDSKLYDLRDCDCFEHFGEMSNVTCHCNKKVSYDEMESNHNYRSSVIVISSRVQQRIESVAQIILKTFDKADQTHNYCFCTENFTDCKCVNPIASYFYYNALPCFCMVEDIMDYPVRCMCNRYILDPILKFDSKVFRFKDCYFMLQNGDAINSRCVETTNPRTRPTWLNKLGLLTNTKLQTKETIETKTILTKNITWTGKRKHHHVISKT